jgi:uncharacterized protein
MFNVCAAFSRASLGAGLLFVSLSAAEAQTPPAAPAPAKTVPDVGQPEPSPEQIAAGRALVIASGMARSFAPMVPQLSDQVVPMLTRTRPELKANLQAVMAKLQPEFAKKGDEMIDIAAKIYARRMSEADLKTAADFFNSPAGKKYVEAQPGMLDEVVLAMQSWTQTLSTFMMTRVHDEMKAKGQDF